MKIVGIIAEYNPFHLGHARHIALTRERTGCDAVIVCMSGSFTQRGEPACLSKHSRALMALRCGADAVFELPALFACRSADAFAAGGVSILGGLGADILSFGCEPETIPLLEQLCELKESEPPELKERIRRGLEDGRSHARAFGEAAAELLGISPEQLDRPNTVLGTEYLRAIRRYAPALRPLVIERNGSYHAQALPADAADSVSATALRARLRDGAAEEAARYVPEPVREVILSAPAMHSPDDLVLWTLRGMEPETLRALPDVAEGLEHRVARVARESSTIEQLLDGLKCRRYTRARLSRLVAHAMLGITDALCKTHPLPGYARLIGMRREARPLLRELSARSTLPIVSDPVRLKDDPVFRIDRKATDLRALCMDAPALRVAGTEFTEKFLLA